MFLVREKRAVQGSGEDRLTNAASILLAVFIVSYLVITVTAMVVNQIAVSNFNAVYAETLDYHELAQLWYSRHAIMPYPGEFSNLFAPACGLIGCLIEMLAAAVVFSIYQAVKYVKAKTH